MKKIEQQQSTIPQCQTSTSTESSYYYYDSTRSESNESHPLLYKYSDEDDKLESQDVVVVSSSEHNKMDGNQHNNIHHRSTTTTSTTTTSHPTPLALSAPLADDTNVGRQHNKHGKKEEVAVAQEKKHSFQFSALAGNVMEWYDFAVFGYFSDVIGHVFFPPQSGNAALVESLCVFGGAFVMRPLGGLLMGYIGDTFGHKLALEVSIWIMALPTFLLGCLPSYEQVGWFAPVGLIFVRLMQGLSVGGQLMSSLVYVADHCPNPQRHLGYHCSFVSLASHIGILLGGLTALCLHKFLFWEQLQTWGWRLPFLGGGIFVTISGLTLKHSNHSSTNSSIDGNNRTTNDNTHHHGGHHHHVTSSSQNPIRGAFSKKNLPSLTCAVGVVILWGASFYLVYVWLAIYMKDLINPPVPNAFVVSSVSMILAGCFFFPVAGMLSDIYGRHRIMFIGGIALSLLGPIWLKIISSTTSSNFGQQHPLAVTFIGILAQSTLGIGVSLWGAPMMAWLVESFDPSVRLTSVAVGYNTAMCIAGGFGPALATILLDHYGPVCPGFLFSFVAPIALLALYVSPTKIYPTTNDKLPPTPKLRKLDPNHYDSCITDDGECYES